MPVQSPRTSSTQNFRISKVISGLITVEVLDQQEARGDPELWNLPCGAGARTPEERHVVEEVQGGLNAVFLGHAGDVKVVKAREQGNGLVGVASVSMTGDVGHSNPVTTEPYIAAITRHNEYHRYVMRDMQTTAGGIVLRAVVEVVMQEKPGAFLIARVRVGNRPSQLMFDAAHFQRVPLAWTHTEQMIRRRFPIAPGFPPLPPDMYRPPGRIILSPGSHEHSLAA
jgi:hypothetical protein